MKAAVLAVPTNIGWVVEWETGEIRTIKRRNGRAREVRMKDHFYSTSKEAVEKKAEELRSKGFEGVWVTECIF